MRVEGAAEAGTVKIRLAFDAWQAGRVTPAMFELPLPAKADAAKK